MSFVAVAIGGGAVAGLAGAYISSNAAGNAAQTQAAAAEQASQLQYQEFQQQQQNEAPWLSAGKNALSQMQNPAFQQSFNMSDFQQDPGYQFQLQQGMSALQNSAAARGGLMSGNTLAGISQYSQGMANTDYQQAYNNFNTNQSNSFNRLASIAGMGQTATGQIGQAGQNYANNAGQNMMGAANAEGAAQIAQGNAWGGALSGIGQSAMTGVMMSKMPGYGPTSSPGSLSGLGSATPDYSASGGFDSAGGYQSSGGYNLGVGG